MQLQMYEYMTINDDAAKRHCVNYRIITTSRKYLQKPQEEPEL